MNRPAFGLNSSLASNALARIVAFAVMLAAVFAIAMTVGLTAGTAVEPADHQQSTTEPHGGH